MRGMNRLPLETRVRSLKRHGMNPLLRNPGDD